MTTIADIVAAEPDPSEAMKRYVGYTLRIGEMRLEILGISSMSLRFVGPSWYPLTQFFAEEHGLQLTHLDLPIFFCSEDPSHDDIIPFLGKGGLLVPPEICCLASPM
jgi:hypothetical protein